MKPPFFILGNPRSGTTVFRLMLNSHPDISVPPECGFALWWFPKFKDWKYLPESVTPFLDDFFSSKKIENWKLNRAKLAEQIHASRPASYAALTDLIYRFYAAGRGKRPDRWGDKNNFYIDHLAELKALFPGVQVLHLVRDGRDVACSYLDLHRSSIESAYLPKLPGQIGDIAREWVDKNRRILDLCHELGDGQGYRLRYEDLIRRPEETLRGVCDFLGMHYHPAMLNYQEDDSEPSDTLQWKRKTREPLDAANIGKFREQLTESEIQTFHHIAGDMLVQFGYSLS